MSPFVLDNSVTMHWCFENTSTAYAEAVLDEMVDGAEALVPVLWLYEVVAVLAKSQRNGSITSQKAQDFLADLQTFSITVDEEGFDFVFTDVHRLAVTYRFNRLRCLLSGISDAEGPSARHARRRIAKSGSFCWGEIGRAIDHLRHLNTG